MQKDFKIGIFLGLVLVAVAVLWLSTWPNLSTKARMLRACRPAGLPHSQNTAPSQETTALSNNPSTNELNTHSTETNQLSMPVPSEAEGINNQLKTRFHIVRNGETLSDISYKYYGSADKWQKIFVANRSHLKDANHLTLGAKLIIPE